MSSEHESRGTMHVRHKDAPSGDRTIETLRSIVLYLAMLLPSWRCTSLNKRSAKPDVGGVPIDVEPKRCIQMRPVDAQEVECSR